MALKLLNLQIIFEKQLTRQAPLLTISRFGHRLRGKPPGVARTLEQRLSGKFAHKHFYGYVFRNRNHLSDERNVDPEVDKKVDIGFPWLDAVSKSDKRKDRMSYIKTQRQSTDLEKQARMQTRNLIIQIVQCFIIE